MHLGLIVLGFVGICAVGLIPLRVWLIGRTLVAGQLQGRALLTRLLASILAIAALLIDVFTVRVLFHCLTSQYCGPGVASGWIKLAMLGVVYLVLELSLSLLRILESRNARSKRD